MSQALAGMWKENLGIDVELVPAPTTGAHGSGPSLTTCTSAAGMPTTKIRRTGTT